MEKTTRNEAPRSAQPRPTRVQSLPPQHAASVSIRAALGSACSHVENVLAILGYLDDPWLYLDLERFPIGSKVTVEDSADLLVRLNDVIGGYTAQGLNEAEVLAAWVDASRVRARRFLDEFHSYSAWERAYLYREQYLDRAINSTRSCLALVEHLRPDVKDVIERSVVDAIATEMTGELKRFFEADAEGLMYVAMEDLADRESGAFVGRLECVRPEGLEVLSRYPATVDVLGSCQQGRHDLCNGTVGSCACDCTCHLRS